eukprot:TRINITY_DN17281_c0_g1_i1.p1 TRINITY_DN17281_c0_g1~~TRINITY_DN17281_c0_g1_i1.p1  ORF type:complete len:172 (-),score=15.91 TRINITY_DN17281_c0_g1_i1:87-602(-)
MKILLISTLVIFYLSSFQSQKMQTVFVAQMIHNFTDIKNNHTFIYNQYLYEDGTWECRRFNTFKNDSFMEIFEFYQNRSQVSIVNHTTCVNSTLNSGWQGYWAWLQHSSYNGTWFYNNKRGALYNIVDNNVITTLCLDTIQMQPLYLEVNNMNDNTVDLTTYLHYKASEET